MGIHMYIYKYIKYVCVCVCVCVCVKEIIYILLFITAPNSSAGLPKNVCTGNLCFSINTLYLKIYICISINTLSIIHCIYRYTYAYL